MIVDRPSQHTVLRTRSSAAISAAPQKVRALWLEEVEVKFGQYAALKTNSFHTYS